MKFVDRMQRKLFTDMRFSSDRIDIKACGIITRFVAMTEIGSGRRDAPDVVVNDLCVKMPIRGGVLFSVRAMPRFGDWG